MFPSSSPLGVCRNGEGEVLSFGLHRRRSFLACASCRLFFSIFGRFQKPCPSIFHLLCDVSVGGSFCISLTVLTL
ncbi:hypothetical protein V6N11_058513 [Hibiscus sabdariffa]|uniref:Uncharacterized protein n=1 Tax=Hibiscus sabdariffa TaxID=183260 RepID=A0ABR2U5A6_9ROSI